MSNVITAAPQEGPFANQPVFTVDDQGNVTAIGVLYLRESSATPTPVAGFSSLYTDTGGVVQLSYTDSGFVRSLSDSFFKLASSPTFTLAAQTATPITLPVAGPGVFMVDCGLIFSNATGSTSVSWTGPAGATMQWNDTGTSTDYQGTISGTNTYASSASTRMAFFKGQLVTTAAGALTVTLGVTAGTTTLAAGSYLRITRYQ